MEQPEDIDILALSLSTLFGAYGKEDQINRLEIYYKALYDLDPYLINNACKKCLYNCTFLPSIAEIINAAKNIELELHPENKIKTWDEALLEISNAIRNITPTQTVKWSTPEIAQAVRMFGFENLYYSSESSYSYAIESIRKNYISITNRIENATQNKGILSMSDGNILGIPNRTTTQVCCTSDNTILLSDIIK